MWQESYVLHKVSLCAIRMIPVMSNTSSVISYEKVKTLFYQFHLVLKLAIPQKKIIIKKRHFPLASYYFANVNCHFAHANWENSMLHQHIFASTNCHYPDTNQEKHFLLKNLFSLRQKNLNCKGWKDWISTNTKSTNTTWKLSCPSYHGICNA